MTPGKAFLFFGRQFELAFIDKPSEGKVKGGKQDSSKEQVSGEEGGGGQGSFGQQPRIKRLRPLASPSAGEPRGRQALHPSCLHGRPAEPPKETSHPVCFEGILDAAVASQAGCSSEQPGRRRFSSYSVSYSHRVKCPQASPILFLSFSLLCF